MIDKILPFLGKYIPAGLAVKGLTSINPDIAKFLGESTAAGYGIDKSLDYLRSIFEPYGETLEKERLQKSVASGHPLGYELKALKAREPYKATQLAQKGAALGGGILAASKGIPYLEGLLGKGKTTKEPSPKEEGIQLPPEVSTVLEKYIQNGQSPSNAALIAQALHKKEIGHHVSALEKKHKRQFPEIVELAYGSTPQQAPINEPRQAPPQNNADQQAMQFFDNLAKRFGI